MLYFYISSIKQSTVVLVCETFYIKLMQNYLILYQIIYTIVCPKLILQHIFLSYSILMNTS